VPSGVPLPFSSEMTVKSIDRNFVAVLHTSDSDKIMRYTDEGETSELCRWTVDLGLLPGFQRHANNPPGGFYTGISIVLDPGVKLTFRAS
jgi:hypothetical protein